MSASAPSRGFSRCPRPPGPEAHLALHVGQVVHGRPQQRVAPLLPLEGGPGHRWRRWLRRAVPAEGVLGAHHQQTERVAAVLELLEQRRVFGVQVRPLVLQEAMEARSHEQKAALHGRPAERGVVLDPELGEARRPGAEVVPVGPVLEVEPKACDGSLGLRLRDDPSAHVG